MDLNLAKQTFAQESRELLDQMEQSLLVLEEDLKDPDALAAIFRAAHTLKGTAGMFQFDSIVHFVHVLENVLDRVRNGETEITKDLVAILLSCHDHIETLVANALSDDPLEQSVLDNGDMLLSQLAAYSNESQSQQIMEDTPSRQEPDKSESPQTEAAEESQARESEDWHISLRFESHVLKNGLDPASFLRYLNQSGEIRSLVVVPDSVPLLYEMDAESCYIGFEVEYHTEKGKEDIARVFEFLEEDAHISILPPRAFLSDIAQLWRDLPESTERLAELFVYNNALNQAEADSLKAKLDGSEPGPEPLGPSSEGAELTFQETPESIGQKADQDEVPQKTEEEGPQGPAGPAEAANPPAKSGGKAGDKQVNVESRFIRVDAAKLDQLINLVGELVIASASVKNEAERNEDGQLLEATSLMSRLVSEMRDATLNVRMVQIGETFNRYRRIVRDLSHEMGKDIDLVISGGDTELDKTVIEKITDPLTHLVRNAVDHGIDSAEKRKERGKSPKGTIWLNAYHETGSIVIEVSDDGRGLNKDKLVQKAVERGVIQSGQQLSDKEIYQLIFQAGFSTADKVSDVSGRGVGMDVVKRNIEALRGLVDIESEEGKGTKVRIRLPLTLAIIDGFFVGVGSTTWVVPLDMVLECLEFDEANLISSSDDKEEREDFFNLRGEVLPFLRLNELFGEEVRSHEQLNIVVVQYAGHKAGLLVDRLMGEYQTVIKPLGPIFQNLRGISGATIMGSGEIALIIDVPRLVQFAKEKEEALETQLK